MEKWDKRFLELSQLIASWSRDPSTKVGAVITNDIEIISMGFNGFPKGIKDDPERYENKDIKYKMVLHAEENAILFANVPLQGMTLYTHPFLPCSSCATKIIQSGIKRVVSYENFPERWKESFEFSLGLFKEAHVNVELYPYVN